MEKSQQSTMVEGPDPVEDAVVTAFQTEFGVQEVALDTPFAALGGDSLRALRVISRLWRELGVELPIDSLQTGTTVTEFVAIVRGHAQPEPS